MNALAVAAIGAEVAVVATLAVSSYHVAFSGPSPDWLAGAPILTVVALESLRLPLAFLQSAGWPGIAERIGRSPAETIDALNGAMALANHHDWVKLSADRLTLGGEILWQALASSWASNCATPQQIESISQPVRDALEAGVP